MRRTCAPMAWRQPLLPNFLPNKQNENLFLNDSAHLRTFFTLFCYGGGCRWAASVQILIVGGTEPRPALWNRDCDPSTPGEPPGGETPGSVRGNPENTRQSSQPETVEVG